MHISSNGVFTGIAVALLAMVPIDEYSQAYPSKLLRIVMSWTPGGTADLLACILALSDVNERLSGFGAEVVSSTPDELDQFNRAQIAKWAKVIKFSSARAD